MENCNFPRVFFICLSFFIIFHHFCFQWCKKNENGKLQFSSSFFHFFYNCLSCFFFHFFLNVSSFLLPVVQKFSKKWKIAIFLEFFFHFFNHCFIIFLSVFIIFASSGAKIFKKWKIAIFLGCFSFFIIFLSCFFFFIFHHFCFQWCKKKIKKNENCNFPRVCFIFLSFFNHVSSFLLPVVKKNSKKWKIAIFLELFFIFFIIVLSFFIIFASSGAKV